MAGVPQDVFACDAAAANEGSEDPVPVNELLVETLR